MSRPSPPPEEHGTLPDDQAMKLMRVYECARSLCFGTDWNNGTTAKFYGWRQQLIDAVHAVAALPECACPPTPTQAVKQAIPSPAPQAPPPEEQSDLTTAIAEALTALRMCGRILSNMEPARRFHFDAIDAAIHNLTPFAGDDDQPLSLDKVLAIARDEEEKRSHAQSGVRPSSPEEFTSDEDQEALFLAIADGIERDLPYHETARIIRDLGFRRRRASVEADPSPRAAALVAPEDFAAKLPGQLARAREDMAKIRAVLHGSAPGEIDGPPLTPLHPINDVGTIVGHLNSIREQTEPPFDDASPSIHVIRYMRKVEARAEAAEKDLADCRAIWNEAEQEAAALTAELAAAQASAQELERRAIDAENANAANGIARAAAQAEAGRYREAMAHAIEMADSRAPDIYAIRGFLRRAALSPGDSGKGEA